MIECYVFDLWEFFMFTDGEVVERKITWNSRGHSLVHSFSYWVSAFSKASYTVAKPKGEFLKSVLLQTRPNGWMRCSFLLIP
jgi:hypothetical protein